MLSSFFLISHADPSTASALSIAAGAALLVALMACFVLALMPDDTSR
jgi:hypothetical protein